MTALCFECGKAGTLEPCSLCSVEICPFCSEKEFMPDESGWYINTYCFDLAGCEKRLAKQLADMEKEIHHIKVVANLH